MIGKNRKKGVPPITVGSGKSGDKKSPLLGQMPKVVTTRGRTKKGMFGKTFGRFSGKDIAYLAIALLVVALLPLLEHYMSKPRAPHITQKDFNIAKETAGLTEPGLTGYGTEGSRIGEGLVTAADFRDPLSLVMTEADINAMKESALGGALDGAVEGAVGEGEEGKEGPDTPFRDALGDFGRGAAKGVTEAKKQVSAVKPTIVPAMKRFSGGMTMVGSAGGSGTSGAFQGKDIKQAARTIASGGVKSNLTDIKAGFRIAPDVRDWRRIEALKDLGKKIETTFKYEDAAKGLEKAAELAKKVNKGEAQKGSQAGVGGSSAANTSAVGFPGIPPWKESYLNKMKLMHAKALLNMRMAKLKEQIMLSILKQKNKIELIKSIWAKAIDKILVEGVFVNLGKWVAGKTEKLFGLDSTPTKWTCICYNGIICKPGDVLASGIKGKEDAENVVSARQLCYRKGGMLMKAADLDKFAKTAAAKVAGVYDATKTPLENFTISIKQSMDSFDLFKAQVTALGSGATSVALANFDFGNFLTAVNHLIGKTAASSGAVTAPGGALYSLSYGLGELKRQLDILKPFLTEASNKMGGTGAVDFDTAKKAQVESNRDMMDSFLDAADNYCSGPGKGSLDCDGFETVMSKLDTPLKGRAYVDYTNVAHGTIYSIVTEHITHLESVEFPMIMTARAELSSGPLAKLTALHADLDTKVRDLNTAMLSKPEIQALAQAAAQLQPQTTGYGASTTPGTVDLAVAQKIFEDALKAVGHPTAAGVTAPATSFFTRFMALQGDKDQPKNDDYKGQWENQYSAVIPMKSYDKSGQPGAPKPFYFGEAGSAGFTSSFDLKPAQQNIVSLVFYGHIASQEAGFLATKLPENINGEAMDAVNGMIRNYIILAKIAVRASTSLLLPPSGSPAGTPPLIDDSKLDYNAPFLRGVDIADKMRQIRSQYGIK